MPLSDLTEEEKAVIFDCLKCVASGKVILHDWEFHTIMGIEVPEFLAVVDKWPEVDDSEVSARLAINNAMNNLLGYPHRKDLKEHIRAPKSEIARVFQKWRGESISGNLSGMM